MQGAVGRRVGRIVLLAAVLASSTLVVVFPSARATTGGPDSYGYIWVDSRSPSPTVPYSWVDITGRGTRLLLTDDNCTFEVALGFQFRFYGTIENNVFICSNGFITFGVPDSFYPDPPIPNALAPNDRIVAFGADINPADPLSGGVYYYGTPGATPKRFVITWDRVYTSLLTPNVPETFQVILEQNETSKDGRIFMQYKSVASITSPLVGIENRTGSSGLAYPNPLANNLAIAFLPPSDQGLPPDTLRVAATSLAPFAVPQGAANVPMMRLDLSTLSNNISVTGMLVNLTGAGALSQDVPSARVWLDNGDGLFFVTNDTLLAAADVAGTPPLMNLPFRDAVRVVVGFPQRLFVTFNIASDAVPGNYVGASLWSSSAISAVYPDLVSPAGLPFNTYVPANRTRIDASRDTLMLTATTPLAPANVAQWETDIPALELRFEADRNYVSLAGLHVELGGNATASDVWAVKLVWDVDGDGNYTAGVDSLLAIAKPQGVPAAATLLFNATIVSGVPLNLLYLLDLAPAATAGHIVDLWQNLTGVFLGGGSVDAISGFNFPAVSGPANITAGDRPTLRLPWILSAPLADGIWMDYEYLLGPAHTAVLDRPLGNRVPGFLTASNGANRLFLAVDATQDVAVDPVEGVAIGFDTDQDGAPTAGADDVFVVNTTGAARYQYNATASAWTFVSTCLPYDPGNASRVACATRVGATGFRSTPHRFYEFSIPLTMLNVTTIAPNTTLRFALAALPYVGLADDGNRSTWPILFGPAPAPLPYFGDLLLATGFRPNRPPTLNWTNETGFTSDAVNPDAGDSNTTFEWRILYSDVDADAPAIGEPQLHVFDGGVELPTSPYSMYPNVGKVNFLTGHIYRYYIVGLSCGGSYSYDITVRDARGMTNATTPMAGPVVGCPDQPPRLFGAGVQPLVDFAGAPFTYRVVYSDPENQTPTPSINVSVRWGDVVLGTFPMAFQTWVGQPSSFADGAVYTHTMRLYRSGFNYSYSFHTSDGSTVVASEEIFGPYVLVTPPDLLTVGCGDPAPLVVDQGARMAQFLTVYLRTSSPEINVTSIQVDRTGSPRDADIDQIVLYADIGGNLTFLKAVAPAASTATFLVNLRVTPAQPVTLFLFANVSRTAVADNMIGLGLRNETYVRVGAGDIVQPFSFCTSTRAYVNAAPSATGLAVNGFPDASPGIEHVRGSAPTLSWRFADSNSADVAQLAFNVSVSSVSPAWEWHRNESGPLTSVAYNGPALAVGQSYTFRVSVFDGRLWSVIASTSFRMNTPPPVPGLVRPTDVARDVDPDQSLLWNPVTDAEGDLVTYWWWISADVGFAAPISGSTAGTGTPIPGLARGTTYYWKVAASDGWQIAGNSTVWQFTTVAVPILGEIRGRVLNGTAPLDGIPVQVLVNGTPVGGDITLADGTFSIKGLVLRSYSVRVAAVGFKLKTLSATPTAVLPVFDLGDIVLERDGTSNPLPDGPTSALPSWAFLVIIVLLAATVATSLIALGIALRRRREEPEPVALPEEKPAKAPPARPRTPATQEPAARSQPNMPASAPGLPNPAAIDDGARPLPPTKAPAADPGPAKTQAPTQAQALVMTPTPPESAPVVYECPECGRHVSADATACACGAVFES